LYFDIDPRFCRKHLYSILTPELITELKENLSDHLKSKLDEEEHYKQKYLPDCINKLMTKHTHRVNCQITGWEQIENNVEKPDYQSMILFHGTGKSNVKSILKEGFKKKYNKVSALGKGTYFTNQFCKALNYCSNKNGKVFVAKIYYKTSSIYPNMQDTDILIHTPGSRFNHHEVVVRDDSLIVPLYCLTVKVTKRCYQH
jgi:hypothetical protein